MIKQLFFITTLLVTIILSSACSTLRSKNYVGKKENIFEKKNIGKDMVWVLNVDEKPTYHVHIVNSNSLVATVVEWDKKTKKHTMKSMNMLVTSLNDYLFLQYKEGEYYTILRLLPSDEESAVLLTINSKKIKKDIEEGKVKIKKTDSDTYTFEGSKKELDDYILKNISTLFYYNGAAICRSISGKLE
jgi:hypothetical protein